MMKVCFSETNNIQSNQFQIVERDMSDREEAQAVAEMEAIPSGPKKVDCPEDDEFLNALDKMVSENIQDRMKESVKASNIDISVPVMVKSNKKTYDQLQVNSVIQKFIFSGY